MELARMCSPARTLQVTPCWSVNSRDDHTALIRSAAVVLPDGSRMHSLLQFGPNCEMYGIVLYEA
jgi:hypothetical protein